VCNYFLVCFESVCRLLCVLRSQIGLSVPFSTAKNIGYSGLYVKEVVRINFQLVLDL